MQPAAASVADLSSSLPAAPGCSAGKVISRARSNSCLTCQFYALYLAKSPLWDRPGNVLCDSGRDE